MYLKIVFTALLYQFWSDGTHMHKSLVFGDEFVAHLKSHQRCSAAFCRPVKFFHTDWIIISLWFLSYTQRHCHVRIEKSPNCCYTIRFPRISLYASTLRFILMEITKVVKPCIRYSVYIVCIRVSLHCWCTSTPTEIIRFSRTYVYRSIRRRPKTQTAAQNKHICMHALISRFHTNCN